MPLWHRVLGEEGGTVATGADAENRPAFVGLQAVIEDIANDPARLETVTRREDMLQCFLKASGTLIAAYPAPIERANIPGIVFLTKRKHVIRYCKKKR